MADDIRRVDTTGYARDPRLTAAASAPQRPTARPAPQHMVLPQHAVDNEPDIEIEDDEAPLAPPPARAAHPPRPAPSAPVQAAVVAAPENSAVIELSRPYMVHGEPLKRFTMRKPVAREIGKIGNPIRLEVGDDGRISEIEARWDRVVKYITALSDPQIPPSSVDEFDFVDLDSCAAFLGPFFLRVTT